MKPEKILFILSLFTILLLLFISQTSNQITMQGEIKNIYYNKGSISIQLENNQTQIIFFTNKILNIKQGQNITAKGKLETYKNKTQFIADKIKCSK